MAKAACGGRPPKPTHLGASAVAAPVALTIAGSDSGGGAGLQADLLTFAAHGVFGTTVVTALTAQNPRQVRAVELVDGTLVEAQLQAIHGAFPVRAAKSGMLGCAHTVTVVAAQARTGAFPLVVDPVLVASSGARLYSDPAVIDAYRNELLPVATLATPNVPEALALLDCPDSSRAQNPGTMPDLAKAFVDRFRCPVLLKGGHLQGDPEDFFWDGSTMERFSHARIDGVCTHGTGCTLSAAIVSRLAHGIELAQACREGITFLQRCLASPLAIGFEQPVLSATTACLSSPLLPNG